MHVSRLSARTRASSGAPGARTAAAPGSLPDLDELSRRSDDEDDAEMSRAAVGGAEPGGAALLHHRLHHHLLVPGHPARAQAHLQPAAAPQLHRLRRERVGPEQGPLQLGDRRRPLPLPPLPHRHLVLVRGEHPRGRWVVAAGTFPLSRLHSRKFQLPSSVSGGSDVCAALDARTQHRAVRKRTTSSSRFLLLSGSSCFIRGAVVRSGCCDPAPSSEKVRFRGMKGSERCKKESLHNKG